MKENRTMLVFASANRRLVSAVVYFAGVSAVPLRLCAAAVVVVLSAAQLALPAQAAQSPVIATLTVGTTPYSMAVSPDSRHVYVANNFSETISIIDTATNTVEANAFAGGSLMTALIIDLTGSNLYVLNSLSTNATVLVINTANGVLKRTITGAGNGPLALAMNPNGKVIYVTNRGDSRHDFAGKY